MEAHHIDPGKYTRGAEDETEDDLVTFCNICHAAVTNVRRAIRHGNASLPDGLRFGDVEERHFKRRIPWSPSKRESEAQGP